MKTKLYTLMASLLLLSCKSVEKMIERGDYDGAFEYSVKKLKDPANRKTKYVIALEDAFRQLNERDFSEIKFIKNSNIKANDAGGWDRVFDLYSRVDRHQNLVRSIMPLVSRTGYEAQIKLVRLEEEIASARQKAIDHYYNQGIQYIDAARKGDKRAARRAVTSFNNIDKYFSNYRNTSQLIDEAFALGTEHIGVHILVDGHSYFGGHVGRKLSGIDYRGLDSRWQEFHPYSEDTEFDNVAVIDLINIDLGPEREYIQDHFFEKVIEDGYDIIIKEIVEEIEVYEDEENNCKPPENVAKDRKKVKKKVKRKIETKVPRHITVRARAIEVKREKMAKLLGELRIYDNASDIAIYTKPISINFSFADDAVRLDGDRRALPEVMCGRLDNYLDDFPTDYAVVEDMSQKFKNSSYRLIKDFDFTNR